MHERTCAACGAQGRGDYCGACGRDYNAGPPSWQDGIYLGKSAPLYRRGAREIRRALPILLAPFRHLDALPHDVWPFALFVALLGVTPLAAFQLFGKNQGLPEFWVYGLYFSLVWAAFFGALFRGSRISWRLAALSYFGTMIVGIGVLQLALAANLEAIRDPLLDDATPLQISVPSFVVFVGFPEELTKALVLFCIWRWAKPTTLRAFIYYGILSGLGFGIAEGISYQTGTYYQMASANNDFVQYYFASVLRLTSLPLLHATWAGTTAFLLWFAIKVRAARTGLVLLAIGLAALMHGLYDGLSDAQPIVSLAVAVLSIGALAIYIAAANQLEASFAIAEGEPAPPPPIAEPAAVS